jgi:Uma2 family endonuclease
MSVLQKRRPKATKKLDSPVTFGHEHNGILMTPEEFDKADFDDFWNFELINGVLVVTPIPLEEEADPNEELGHLLRQYRDAHPMGHNLNGTLSERYVKSGRNRRKPDRIIWASLGRRPRRGENPTIIVEFVSSRKRDRERDYREKRAEYLRLGVKEYWIVDRFARQMMVITRGHGKVQPRVVAESQSYETKLLPGFVLPLARLFVRSDSWATEEPDKRES